MPRKVSRSQKRKPYPRRDTARTQHRRESRRVVTIVLPDHKHRRLSSAGSIRVVDVLPGTKENLLIQCKLREVRLDSSVAQYEALSYAWGDSNKTCTILCDEQRLSVTENCWLALHSLRHEDRVRTLWADAVCIDQSCDQEGSIQERNHQIKLMGMVYNTASCVLVWLGPEEESTPKVFEFCELAQRLPENHQQGDTDPTTELMLNRLKTMINDDNVMFSFWRMIISPWFFRMWTVQEIAFASEAFLIIGPRSLGWNTFLRGYDYLVLNTFFGMSNHFQVNLRRDTIRYARLYPHTTFNIPSLQAIRNLQCARPHDKIYGMYAILALLGIPLEDPDYDQPVTELIDKITLSLIQHFKSLSFMMLTLPSSSSPGRPSWVPDWLTPLDTHLDVEYSGIFPKGGHDTSSFRASRDTKHNMVPGVHHSNGAILAVPFHSHLVPEDSVLEGSNRWVSLMMEPRNSPAFLEAQSAFQSSIRGCERIAQLGEGSASTIVEVFRARLHDMENDDPLTLITNLLDIKYNPSIGDEDVIQVDANFSVEYAFIHLDSGYIGRAHHTCREGDQVWLLAGADKPVVLRKQEETGTFRVVAPAFIAGAMDGELWPDEGKIEELQDITLV
ncbi:heterokaryon incompatibility protein-domain-containing protein [Apiospora arundinis]|uniref:Heterokaryon incompatibility protein-domain-containing protein n=1 Tax=Apiospora arundinis TaxID=335852 RepID=A0ABR2I9T7_9PEZI